MTGHIHQIIQFFNSLFINPLIEIIIKLFYVLNYKIFKNPGKTKKIFLLLEEESKKRYFFIELEIC